MCLSSPFEEQRLKPNISGTGDQSHRSVWINIEPFLLAELLQLSVLVGFLAFLTSCHNTLTQALQNTISANT